MWNNGSNDNMAAPIRTGDICLATRKKLAKFDQIRGKSKEEFPFPFWDMVVLTTGDEVQKLAYQKQIDDKLERGHLPRGIPYHVFSDPPGPKSGCGGSTMYVISKLHQMYGEEVKKYCILLINAGGQSQRLPSASILGKIFTAFPLGDPMYQALEIKLASYIPFLERMNPGFFHAASDTIEVFDLGSSDGWTFERSGFTAIAHPSTLEIGKGHGVFVLQDTNLDNQPLAEFRECLEVLQKPSSEVMYNKGAVIPRTSKVNGKDEVEEIVYTDSAFYFDHDVAYKLMKFYEEESPLECEIDAYGDFHQALGPRASIDFARNTANVVKVEPKLISTRERIFHLLKGTPLNLVLLNASKFYHLGTTKEYIDNFCRDEICANEMGFQRQVMNGIISNHPKNNYKKAKMDGQQGCLMHNILCAGSFVSSDSIVEYCSFCKPVDVGKNSIVSNCRLDESEALEETINIPDNVFLHTVAVQHQKKTKFVTIVFATDDNLKKQVSHENLQKLSYLKQSLPQVAAILGFKDANMLYEDKQNQTLCLWEARLFPLRDTMSDSFQTGLQLLRHIQTKEYLDISDMDRFSMSDLLNHKDAHAMLDYRNKLAAQIHEVMA